MAADTILVRFRDLSNIAAGTVSNSDFEDKYQTLALQMYNEIMDTSLQIQQEHILQMKLCPISQLPLHINQYIELRCIKILVC